MIEFFLNGRKIELLDVEPELTVLRYLRGVLNYSGTKEGCGSGDCGACTVMLGHAVGDIHHRHINYKIINSCIAPIASIHGKHLVTIEGLCVESGQLHPVQQAMVDCNASQCGFCTPGVVMSLACLYENTQSVTAEQVIHALSGNLCRCTGYNPIVKAGLCMHKYSPVTNAITMVQASELDLLTNGGNCSSSVNPPGLQSAQGSCMYPETETMLHYCMEIFPDAQLIAGGTDLMLESTQQFQLMPQLIGLGRVKPLTCWNIDKHNMSLGAALTFSQLESIVYSVLPSVSRLIRRIGSNQIRNIGTIGGNLANASPVADLPAILLVLNAQIELATSQGVRLVSVESFYVGYKHTILKKGEYIRRVIIPVPSGQDFFTCYKVSKRVEDDISTVMMAVRWRITNDIVTYVQIAYAGMASVPKRAVITEAALLGKTLNEETIDNIIPCLKKDFSPITDVRASSDYRLEVAGRLLKKARLEYLDPSVVFDVSDRGGHALQ